MTAQGYIFDIKKYAIHDGPNIRTTVFFKGCPLRCAWCHNPEGLTPGTQQVWKSSVCLGCGQCIEQCPAHALGAEKNGIFRDKKLCTGCGLCVDTCPALAHEAVGRSVDVADVMAEIKKDIPFYDQSGGGVTFSGGDPLFQPEFLLNLLEACKAMDLHCAVDTCLYTQTRLLESIVKLTDLFLIDIKHMDSRIHENVTGKPNGLILDNIRFLASTATDIRFRIPLIDGVNADPENIDNTARFIAGVRAGSRVDLLPYHDMARTKYEKLGMASQEKVTLRRPTDEQLKRCQALVENHGLCTTIGG